MTFLHNELTSTENTGIKGTALITATDNYNSTYGYFTQIFYALVDSNKVSQIRYSRWDIRDITGDFDAFAHDGNLGRVSATGTNGRYRILANKKILVMARFTGNTSHTATNNVRCKIVTHSGGGTNYSVSTSTITTGSLNQYYAPEWRTHSSLNYTGSFDKNPPDLNSSEVGKYFRRAGIHSLDPEIMYAYIETPSSGTFNLGVHILGGPSTFKLKFDPAKEMHFMHIIQFD